MLEIQNRSTIKAKKKKDTAKTDLKFNKTKREQKSLTGKNKSLYGNWLVLRYL